MDKRIIFAVARSGKTSHIIKNLCLEKRHLITTYTKTNIHNLRLKIIHKFGFFPENITLLPYFNFLYSFCYRPILAYKLNTSGLSYSNPPDFTQTLSRDNDKHYISSSGRLYHSRLGKLLIRRGATAGIQERLQKFYDHFYIDEVQDFAGNDFDLLKEIVKADINIMLVGDFFQHTYDTSRDGNIYKKLHQDIEEYIQEFENMGLKIDMETLNKNYRCSPTICDFITNNLGVNIESHRDDTTEIKFEDDKSKIRDLMQNDQIIKLFFNKNTSYSCTSRNWGECKGEDCYNDVCVILNATSLKLYNKKKLLESAPLTKNKLYVACTRAKGNLYFISHKEAEDYKIE